MSRDESAKKTFSEQLEVINTTNTPPEEEEVVSNESLLKLKEENRFLSSKVKRLEEESTTLREMFNNVSNELNHLKKPALLVAEVATVKENKAVIKLTNGNKFYSHISKEVKNLKAGDAVLVDQKSVNIIDKIDFNDNYEVEKFVIIDKPKEKWDDIGGLKEEIREVKEVIELPLKKPELFEKIGIKPPKGILLYGPPGTGKTLLAKAAASSTNATFIEIVGSELVQKFIGEGAKLVKEIFELARRRVPSIVFIDEIDAVAATRMETGTSGEREVNRTFMQLLAELDGFRPLDKVKVVGATNRIDILDKAVLRPGRLDRLIEVGLPNEKGRLEIFKVHSKNMNLKKVRAKQLTKKMTDFSGADIRAVCTEAGYFAIRNNRSYVTQEDFIKASKKVKSEEDKEYKKLFG
ncbi:proteasome-activating nucleotidase [Candidatus Woesearchaeota archaeon]|nr:proteasome-activating nucleotidase [Candidatus Woesearchaeota archaeon]